MGGEISLTGLFLFVVAFIVFALASSAVKDCDNDEKKIAKTLEEIKRKTAIFAAGSFVVFCVGVLISIWSV